MPEIAWIKAIHVGCVAISGAGFVLRGVWMLRGSSWLEARPTRIIPHVVDSVLLASAIGLAVATGQYPFVVPWLSAKVFGLIAYILLGAIALRHGRSRRQRQLAFGLALTTFLYVVSVAVFRDPCGFVPGCPLP